MLKRIVEPYEIHKCDYSEELIIRGEFYYEDTEDGYIIKASVYHELKEKAKKETFDYSMLEKAQNEYEYREAMKLAEKELLSAGILEREIASNGKITNSTLEKLNV